MRFMWLLAATVNGHWHRDTAHYTVYCVQGIWSARACSLYRVLPAAFRKTSLLPLIVRLMRSVSRRIVGQNEFTRIPPKLANGHSEQSSKESLCHYSLPLCSSPWSPPVLLMMEIWKYRRFNNCNIIVRDERCLQRNVADREAVSEWERQTESEECSVARLGALAWAESVTLSG